MHHCVGYEGLSAGTSWNFRHNGEVQSMAVRWRLMVNSIEAAVVAAEHGAGIARVLSYQIDRQLEARSLVTVLDQYEPGNSPVTLIYPGQRQVPVKLRAFLEFAAPRLKARLTG
ncbi:hypothetical protein CIC12_28935 [Burkholderia sp. SG-MS1]|uniref:LysR substrate-binding domain-containing protein n=1 Tax=Paraburkholderia sp. SG-MS1 TaxID=2023741 RepID=UPI0014456369|nr:LysR substrate-binding domain-containing protein [Paraburkholderia sp. SG-MS1]NKJ50679.1 hypothetical protein [Paraburkholderia sp. SG-MS1]